MSMGSIGDCYDNAMCESFNATMECELLDRHRFETRAEAETAIFDFIASTPMNRLRCRVLFLVGLAVMLTNDD